MLADMSNGALARVGAISEAAEGESVGNQLVGNPNYGQWQTNSSGTLAFGFGMACIACSVMCLIVLNMVVGAA